MKHLQKQRGVRAMHPRNILITLNLVLLQKRASMKSLHPSYDSGLVLGQLLLLLLVMLLEWLLGVLLLLGMLLFLLLLRLVVVVLLLLSPRHPFFLIIAPHALL